MVYGKLDCRRENDTLLLPQKSSESSDEAHNHRPNRPTDMPMVVSFSAAFRVPIKGGILPLQGFA